MKTPKRPPAPRALAAVVQEARKRLAKAESAMEASAHRRAIAKRHRQEAKETARDAKKDFKQAKQDVADAAKDLAKAEHKYARAVMKTPKDTAAAAPVEPAAPEPQREPRPRTTRPRSRRPRVSGPRPPKFDPAPSENSSESTGSNPSPGTAGDI